MKVFFISLTLFALFSCGKKNVGEKQEVITPEDKAQKLMNDDDFAGAIAILEPLALAEPESYVRFPLLAAAYAGLADVDVISILESMLTSNASSPLMLILDFLPTDIDEDTLDTLGKGVDLLKQIPKSKIGPDGDPVYGESAELQLVLYQTIYSAMLLRLIFDFDANGNIDADSLKNLTIADAERILRALAGAASTAPTGSNAAVIGDSVQTTLDDIDAEPGSDDAERLSNYLGSAK